MRNSSELGPVCRSIRRAYKLSIEEVAHKCELAPKTVGRFERGMSPKAHPVTIRVLVEFYERLTTEGYLGHKVQ